MMEVSRFGGVNDKPRLLRNKEEQVFRRAELSEPHIKPLATFAKSLRKRDYGQIPDFDPWDGGIFAQALFLFEKPGPKAFESGFISRNNDDPTAENTFNFMIKAGIPREKTCLWNVVPGWNGTIKLTSDELARGAAALSELLDLLRDLRVVVLVGKRASRAWSRYEHERGLHTIVSAHPSPMNYAMAREAWDAIPGQWSAVRRFLTNSN